MASFARVVAREREGDWKLCPRDRRASLRCAAAHQCPKARACRYSDYPKGELLVLRNACQRLGRGLPSCVEVLLDRGVLLRCRLTISHIVLQATSVDRPTSVLVGVALTSK